MDAENKSGTQLLDENRQLRSAVRYALATFRALDQYTFGDSDHGLLIQQAVKILEDAQEQ